MVFVKKHVRVYNTVCSKLIVLDRRWYIVFQKQCNFEDLIPIAKPKGRTIFTFLAVCLQIK